MRSFGAETTSIALMKAAEFLVGENLRVRLSEVMLIRYSLNTILVVP